MEFASLVTDRRLAGRQLRSQNDPATKLLLRSVLLCPTLQRSKGRPAPLGPPEVGTRGRYKTIALEGQASARRSAARDAAAAAELVDG